MSEHDESEKTIEDIEKEREERKEALAAARAAQHLIDIAVLNELEIEHGDDNVVTIPVSRYCAGMVTLAVARALRVPEMKRFRDRTKGEDADTASAAEEVTSCCLLYPKKDSPEWGFTCEKVTGLAVRVGSAAVHLAAGVECREGK